MARKGYKTASFTLPDGTRKYVYAKTQEELDDKVFNLKLQMKMGVNLSDKTTVGELVQLWYRTEVEPNIQRSSASTVKGILNNHLLPLVSTYVAKDVTPLQVKIWLNEFNKLNKNSAGCCLRALRNAFDIAEENGLVYKSPVLRRYKAGGFSPQKRSALTPQQESDLLKATENTKAHLFVWMALATGMRRGELLGLMWDCVDLDNATVEVRRNLVPLGRSENQLNDYTKTAAGMRTLPLPFDLCAELRRHKSETRSMFVFTTSKNEPYTAADFSRLWDASVHRKYGPDAVTTRRSIGVVAPIKVTPHVLRHTYATRCFESGLDIKEVQYLLGHANPQVTMGVYTHYCQESRRDATFSKAREARSCTTSVPRKAVKGG